MSLHGQFALVTGASSGIGAAVAVELGRRGAAVAVNYRSDDAGADRVVAAIESAGGMAFAFKADVSREDDVHRLYEAVDSRWPRLDILVANAGIQKDAAIEEMTVADWNAVLGVNLTGQFLCARPAVARFRRQGVAQGVSRAAGKIVCMSSVHDVIPWAGRANYAASKGGVSLFMRSLAQEVAADRIRVNAISPGAIATDINREAWEEEENRRRLLELIPYGRVGEAEDIARVAAWLVSDEADYITGTTIYVDGGMTLYPAFIGQG